MLTCSPYSPALLAFVAIGGALGAISRFVISSYIAARSDALLPLGTLVVNTLGSFLIGLLIVLVSERFQLPQSWRVLLIAGFLGSLTTFSTFSLELVQLLNAGHWISALTYTLASVLLCVALVALGMFVGRLI